MIRTSYRSSKTECMGLAQDFVANLAKKNQVIVI